jgi:glycosyltransferase involved in cell wall biosynthesis
LLSGQEEAFLVDLSVVIPVYNGRNNLTSLIQDLIPVLNESGKSWEIFFVDDHSRDNSFDLIRDFNREDKRIRGCQLRENRGQQNALLCGIHSCRGDLILTMDDDGQHPPRRIPEMLGALETGVEGVYMVRTGGKRSWLLRWGTNLTDLFFTLFLGKPGHVKIGSYRIIKRSLVERFPLSGSFAYISALIFLSRPRPVLKTLFYHNSEGRNNGESRFSFKSRIHLFGRLFFYYGPLKLIGKVWNRRGKPYDVEEIL